MKQLKIARSRHGGVVELWQSAKGLTVTCTGSGYLENFTGDSAEKDADAAFALRATEENIPEGEGGWKFSAKKK